MIINNSNNLVYFDIETNTISNNIWNKITYESLSESNLNNHLLNSNNYIQSPNHYAPVLKNIFPIPPRSKWSNDRSRFECIQSLEVSEYNHNLFTIISKLVKPIKKYKVGVELSGGLDSSIIISMLIENGIEPFLIGYSCDRYEFRTERYIQSIFSNKVKESILINSKDILPFQNLKGCPPHQIPNPSSLYYFNKQIIADSCKENGVDILFNGISGDSFFCESVFGNEMPNLWHNWMLDNRWFHENVFYKKQIHYLPVYSKNIAESIFMERKGMGYDSQKIWARNYFKDYLPKELVYYNYKADHVGDLIVGIQRSYYDVKDIFEFTRSITKKSEFSEENLLKLFDNIEKYNENQLKEIMGKVSYATWIYSLRDIIE